MKKHIALLAFVAVIASGVAFGGMKIQLSANVPFDFYVEDQLLPAGEYRFEMGSSALIIRAKDGTGVRMLATMNGENENKSEDFLQFHQYGNKRFLSGVAAGSSKAIVKTAKTEQEVKAQIKKAEELTLTAGKQDGGKASATGGL